MYLKQTDYGITDTQIEDVYEKIKQNAGTRFIEFYDSYRRKIDMHYFQEYVDNALRDVKMAYQIYRKSSNPDWDSPAEQISISEMENLYSVLTNTNTSHDVASGDVPR